MTNVSTEQIMSMLGRVAGAPFPGLLISLACLTSAPASAQGVPGPELRQVTHSENYDPAISPDGRSMVYLSLVAGREQMFLRSLKGREIRQLTSDSVDHEDPAWSPDGREIAFVSLSGKTARIAVLPLAGGPPKFLTPDTERAIHPNWSPDGRLLAYCTDDDLAPPKKNAADIKVIDMATGTIRVLITGGINTYPVWSPDGRQIAFRRMVGDTNSEVFVADRDGGNARNLTNSPAFDGWPAWAPDGTQLAFASNRDGPYQVYLMAPDGTGVRLVAPNAGRATSPKWSPDGRTLYYPVCLRNGDGYDCEIFAADVPAPAGR
jgi:TolB protein